MTVSTTIRSGDQASSASPSAIPVVLGCSSSGVVGGVGGHSYAFDPGDDVAGVLGGGPGPDGVLALLASANGRVLYQECTKTWSPAPSVTHTGSGPAVTCALANGASGCFDDHTIVATVKVPGLNGVAQIGICYDGSTEIETVTVPTEPAPHIIGTIDLTGLTLSTLAAETLIFTAPASLTVTFSSPVSIQDIVNQINTAASATVIRAQLKQTTSGQFLDLYTTVGGASETLTLGTGTADATLGFTNAETATGSAATLALPFTGLVLTFPAGTYAKGDIYKMAATGPRASITAVNAAATAAHDDYRTNPFGLMFPAQAADTGSNCQALDAQLSSLVTTWRADPNAPIFVQHCVGGPFHVASAVRATNDANIATNDAALLAAFSGAPANTDSVAGDDCYVPGAATLRAGTFRRTAAIAWAIKRASASKIAADVADGLVPGVGLLAPDLNTRARDEASATTKLGGGAGPGFSVLHSTSTGLGDVKFSPGATRAGASSRLRFSGVVAIANEIARLIFGVTEPWEGQTWATNPLTKQIEDGEKSTHENSVIDVLKPTLRPDDGVANVSAFAVSIDNSGPFLDNGRVPLKVPFVPLGEVEQVIVSISATGTVAITG